MQSGVAIQAVVAQPAVQRSHYVSQQYRMPIAQNAARRHARTALTALT